MQVFHWINYVGGVASVRFMIGSKGVVYSTLTKLPSTIHSKRKPEACTRLSLTKRISALFFVVWIRGGNSLPQVLFKTVFDSYSLVSTIYDWNINTNILSLDFINIPLNSQICKIFDALHFPNQNAKNSYLFYSLLVH